MAIKSRISIADCLKPLKLLVEFGQLVSNPKLVEDIRNRYWQKQPIFCCSMVYGKAKNLRVISLYFCRPLNHFLFYRTNMIFFLLSVVEISGIGDEISGGQGNSSPYRLRTGTSSRTAGNSTLSGGMWSSKTTFWCSSSSGGKTQGTGTLILF